MDFCGYPGGFECLVVDLHANLSQGDHLAHRQGCGCAGCAENLILNDFLFVMAFLVLLETKLDFNKAKDLVYIVP